MTTAELDPLELTFTVSCSVEHAFATWTGKFGTWWPRSHTMSGADRIDVILEPGLGGRIFERTETGEECDWGEVTRWEPPTVVGFRWHLMSDVSDATDVEINFDRDGPDSTIVRIVHSGWERLGAAGPERRHRNRAGWSGVFEHFRAAAERR